MGKLPKPEKEIPKIAVPKLIKIAFIVILLIFLEFSHTWSKRKGLGRFDKTHEVKKNDLHQKL